MASFSSATKLIVSFFSALLVFFSFFLNSSYADTFDKETEIIWGKGNTKMSDDGTALSLSLDRKSGSSFKSKDAYLFGQIDIQMKLVEGNSAGTVSTFYTSSIGPNHDEVDFEFLGNLSGQPYVLHTNLFVHGIGEKEMQFYLWFDPTADFHTYSILWNPRHLAFLVDGVPVRDFINHEDKGLFFPSSQPMNVYCSIWDAEGWATMGGRVKTDWNKAPFTVHYQNYNPQACIPQKASMVCNLPNGSDWTWLFQELDELDKKKMKWAYDNFNIYDYCTDLKRWPKGVPPECLLR